MSPRLTFLVPLLALAACAAAAQPEPALLAHEPAAGMSCEVRALTTPMGVALEAVAYTETAIAGAYQFTITKDDAGGASDISQGGAFEATPGVEMALGGAELSVARGGRLDARLVVLDAAGGELCRDSFQS